MPRAGLRSSGKTANVAVEMREHLKTLLAAAEVALTAELAELLRHRELVWGLIPPLSRKLVLPYLTVKETLRLDSSVTERGDEENPGDRDHLVKAYKGLRSAGFDEWVYKNTKLGNEFYRWSKFEGVDWARKRGVDLQNLQLEYDGERDVDKVLGQLVVEGMKDMATYYAARSEARDTYVLAIIPHEEDSEYDIEYYSTTLVEAARGEYLEVMKCLLDRGADVNEADELGNTPLHRASLRPWFSLEMVKTLLEAKAEVNKANEDGNTPLHEASSGYSKEVVETLLAAKAEVNKANNWGDTPLHRASRDGGVKVVKALLAAEAEVDKANNWGDTPLHLALEYNRTEIVALLRAAGATK